MLLIPPRCGLSQTVDQKHVWHGRGSHNGDSLDGLGGCTAQVNYNVEPNVV